MKPGRSLKMLVAFFRHRLDGLETASIESPKLMRDRSTGRVRSHDAVLTVISGHHTYLIGVQCRDGKRPVGRPQIEAFARKCRVTSIDKPVMVSPCGFTGPALIRAHELGIHCLGLEETEDFPWIKCETTHERILTQYTRIDFTIITADSVLYKKSTSYTLVNDDGDVVPTGVLRDYMLAVLIRKRKDPSEVHPGSNVERVRLMPTNLSVINADTGICKKVQEINLVAYSRNEDIDNTLVNHIDHDVISEISFARLSRLLGETCAINAVSPKPWNMN